MLFHRSIRYALRVGWISNDHYVSPFSDFLKGDFMYAAHKRTGCVNYDEFMCLACRIGFRRNAM